MKSILSITILSMLIGAGAHAELKIPPSSAEPDAVTTDSSDTSQNLVERARAHESGPVNTETFFAVIIVVARLTA